MPQGISGFPSLPAPLKPCFCWGKLGSISAEAAYDGGNRRFLVLNRRLLAFVMTPKFRKWGQMKGIPMLQSERVSFKLKRLRLVKELPLQPTGAWFCVTEDQATLHQRIQ